MKLGQLYDSGYKSYMVTGYLEEDMQALEVKAKCEIDAKHIARAHFIQTVGSMWRYVPLEAVEIHE